MQAAQFDDDGRAAAQAALERGRAGVAREGPGHVGVARGRRGLSIERRICGRRRVEHVGRGGVRVPALFASSVARTSSVQVPSASPVRS